MDDPDLPLVEALQRGDDAALTALMTRHRHSLFRFLFRYTHNETVAADLAQETFVRAYFGIGEFRPRAKFSTWMHQIALNLCRDRLRSRDYKRSFSHDSLAAAADQAALSDHRLAPDAEAQAREHMIEVQRLIDDLPEQLKAAFILNVLEGLPQKEVGEILGITAKAVEARVYRARHILEERLFTPGIGL